MQHLALSCFASILGPDALPLSRAAHPTRHRPRADPQNRPACAHMAPGLSPEELQQCRRAFASFDRNGSGTIDVRELRAALEAMGQHVTEEELFVMIHQVSARRQC